MTQRILPAFALCLLIVSAVFAVDAPPPTPVTPTFPVIGYVDRYLDSTMTRDYQTPIRTYRAYKVKVAPELDRIFMIHGGGTFAAFRASTFPKRLAEPMIRMFRSNGDGELYANPDMKFAAESAGWYTPIIDGQDRLYDFDWDDRGNIYLAYSIFGWGIITSQGQSLVQKYNEGYTPSQIHTLKVGSTYYAFVGAGFATTTRLYDVTNPASPTNLPSLPFTIGMMARTSTAIAIFTGSELRIYTPEQLIAAGTFTTVSFPGEEVRDVTTDGTSFYVATGAALNTKVYEVTTAGSAIHLHTLMDGMAYSLDYGAGYLALLGDPTKVDRPNPAAVLRRESGIWKGFDLSSYFSASYTPKPRLLYPYQLVPAATPNGTFLFAAMYGIGDVFKLFSSTGSGAFSPHTTASFGPPGASAIAAGDLDSDGDQDVVTAHAAANESVWLNSGSGVFTAHPTVFGFDGGAGSSAVALGDLDRDGDLDAVIANTGTAAETVWLNGGSGNFSAHPTTPAFGSGNSTDIALGDLDSDGDLDAIVANTGAEAETVWLNDGTGAFSASSSFGAGDSTAIALGDVDGDTDLDAVVSNDSGQAETVWVNNGSAAFSAHPLSPSFGGGNSNDVVLGDVDGDCDLDVLIANGGTEGEGVWINDGTGTLSLGSTIGAGNSRAIALADLDGDGDRDAVVANFSEANTVWVNDGSGTFASHPTVATFGDSNAGDLALVDLDADSDPDAIVPKFDGTVYVWVNRNRTTTTVTTSPAPSYRGETITLTATVTTPSTQTPTGTVTFSSGATTIGSVGLTDGVASITTATLATGAHTITALYAGNSACDSSIGSVPHQVNAVVAPTSVTAEASTPAQVMVSWPPARGATSYEIHRATTISGPFTSTGATAETSYADNTVSPETTYLYKVRGMGVDGAAPFSPVDAATTMTFTDPSLVGITVKAVHLTELRTAVDAMRTAAGHATGSFTDALIAGETVIKRIHLVELRTALDSARAAIGLAPISYTDPDVVAGATVIRKEHVTDLRAGTQ